MRTQEHLWVCCHGSMWLMRAYNTILMSAHECHWILMKAYGTVALAPCSSVLIAGCECSWALMNNYEGSRELISSHKCQEQPSSAMSSLEHGAKVPNVLMTTHKHASAHLHMASTALMSTHDTMATYLWVLMRAPEYSWVLIKLSWVLWSAPECSWLLLSAPVCSSGCFKNKQKMLTFSMPSL